MLENRLSFAGNLNRTMHTCNLPIRSPSAIPEGASVSRLLEMLEMLADKPARWFAIP